MSLFERRSVSQIILVFDDAALPTRELLEQVLQKNDFDDAALQLPLPTSELLEQVLHKNDQIAGKRRISCESCESIDILTDMEYSSEEEDEEYKAYSLGESAIMDLENDDWLLEESISSLCEQPMSYLCSKDLPTTYNKQILSLKVPQPKIAVPRSA
jgi:hypothetical protein